MASFLTDIASDVGYSLKVLRPVVARACVLLSQAASPPPSAAATGAAALTFQPSPAQAATCSAIARFVTLAGGDDISLPYPPPFAVLRAGATVALALLALLALGYAALHHFYLRKRQRGTYLIDVATYDDFRPEWTVSAEEWAIRAQQWFNMDPEDISFSRKILERSGIGPRTHFPPGIAMFPPDLSIASARYEAELVMFNCIDKLLKQNNVQPKDIDILVVNCSLFNPTPSLAAMVINNYKLRDDIVSYNLSGMGCSASPIAVNLASELLKVSPKRDPLAIVVSMEIITQNIYVGKERAMMVANSLFRMGGAAMLLSRTGVAMARRPAPKWRLNNLVRVHLGADTNAYTCVFQDIDKEKKPGVRLDKTLMGVAAKALTKNMTKLGPQILPWHEKLRYAARVAMRAVQVWRNPAVAKTLPPIVPDFKTAVEHIAIHSGGRAVIDAIQKSLNLSDADVKPSRDVLYKYGNTSSSSIWYEFKEIEEQRKPRVGDRLWQIAFGSGFKCNSAVWEKIA